MTAEAPPRSARERSVRRNTILLAAAVGLAATTFPVMLLVGSLAAAEITGHDSSVGLLNGLYFIAAAGGALSFGRAMDRFGRRPGLAVAYLMLAAAGGVCALGSAIGSFPLLLAGAAVFGVAFGGTNLARAAVADMHAPEHRGRAVGIVLAMSTIGAVGSPFLVALLRSWAESTARDPNVVPWVIVPASAVAALLCAVALRPDPRELAVAVDAGPATEPVRGPVQLLQVPLLRMAVVVAAVGQMAMVSVMSVTPLALHHHDTSSVVVSTVISFHIAGMWAFSPFIGAALDRFGRRPGILVAGAVSISGCLLAATDAGPVLVAAGLFAIGLGWSGSFLGATAVISDLTRPNERAGALGFNDLVVSLSSAVASLAGGFVFETAGFRTLGVGVAGLVLLVVLSLVRVRQPAEVLAER